MAFPFPSNILGLTSDGEMDGSQWLAFGDAGTGMSGSGGGISSTDPMTAEPNLYLLPPDPEFPQDLGAAAPLSPFDTATPHFKPELNPCGRKLIAKWAVVRFYNEHFDQWQRDLLDCKATAHGDFQCYLPEVAEDNNIEGGGAAAGSNGACPATDYEEYTQLSKAVNRLLQWQQNLSECQSFIDQFGFERYSCHHSFRPPQSAESTIPADFGS
ncbi:hypothetical protein MMC29_008520 [Sticta canariensis]|nr:hypothetical protein [Sticta canariensis]